MVLFCIPQIIGFCVGLSIAPAFVAQPVLYLQIKNTLGNVSSLFNRMDWQWFNEDSLHAWNNPEAKVGLVSKTNLIIRAGNVNLLSFLPQEQTRLETTNGQCVTIMQCQRKQLGFCNPNALIPVNDVKEIKLGSYLKLQPCLSPGHPSQTLHHIYHNCSFSKLTNTLCDDPDCNLPEFAYDKGFCPAPSAAPSVTTPSVAPSVVPSAQPSAAPSVAPSALPSATPSAAPSATPSVTAPSAAPSAAPSTAPPSATAPPNQLLGLIALVGLPLPVLPFYYYYFYP
jgi:hypothetical protein